MQCPSCQTEIDYCPSCGASLSAAATPALRASIVFEQAGEQTQLSVLLTKDQYLIGRCDEAKGRFPEIDLTALDSLNQVSRCHARIYRQGEQFYVEDLRSVNGTFIVEGAKSVRVEPQAPRRLSANSQIRFGMVRSRFLLESVR